MSGSNQNDAESIARCLSGETQAFRGLVLKYQFAVYNAAFAILGEAEEAKDATQTAFVKAWERLHTYDPSRKFFSWLYRIAVNEALNRKRSAWQEQPLVEHQAVADRPHDPFEHDEVLGRLRTAIAALPDEQKIVVLMHYFEEMSYREIAEALELAEATIKSRLYEARQKLRKALQ